MEPDAWGGESVGGDGEKGVKGGEGRKGAGFDGRVGMSFGRRER